MQEYICNVNLFYKLASKMSALKYDKPMSSVLSAMSVLIYFVSKMSALKYLFDKPMSTVLSEMSIDYVRVCVCVCTCVCTCGKAVVLPVLHKIIINKDDKFLL